MATNRNEFHIVAFDPGGTIGWAYLSIHKRAFTSHKNKVLRNILQWDTGEFEGTEHDQIQQAIWLMREARYEPKPFVADTDYVSEAFHLTQIIGGEELLSPVRINAILDWECQRNVGKTLQFQNRNLRTGVTKNRLKLWGLDWEGKDSFAAMQHAITWLRRVKRESNERPWKLDEY